MADKWPLANGNYSNAANWNGGTLPVDGDDIYLDNRTITLDQTVNLPNARLLTTQRSGGTAGGLLSVSAPTTVDVTLLAIVAGTSVPFSIQSSFTGTISVATITGSQSTLNINAMTVGVGSHNITFSNCSFVGGSGANRNGLSVTSGSGSIVFSNCTATGGLGGAGISIAGGTATCSGVLNLTNIVGATAQALSLLVNPTTVVLSGSCTQTCNVGLAVISNGATLRYTCTSLSFVNTTNSGIAVFQFSTATQGNELIFPSPITMHNQSAGPYLASYNTAFGKVCVYGDITCGTGGVASYVFNISSGTLERVGEDICGDSAIGNLVVNLAAVSTAFYIADKIRCGASGPLTLPYGPGVRFKSTSRIIAQDSLGNPVTLQPPAALVDLPVPSDVREGVIYNNSTQVGTYNAGNEIAEDVWTYATRTITAGGLDAAGVRAAVGLAAANIDSQISSLDNSLDAIKAATDNLQFDGNGHLYVDVMAINADANSAEALQELIQAGTFETILAKVSGGEITWTSPVTQQGKLNPIVIGDDYLAASGRAFDWFVDPGVFNIAAAQCFFGFAGPNVGRVAVSGTVSAVTISGNPKWRLRFELTNAATKTLKPGEIEYSVELRGPTPEHVTKRFGKGTVVQSFTVDAA